MPIVLPGNNGISEFHPIFETPPPLATPHHTTPRSRNLPFGSALLHYAKFAPPKVHITIGESLGPDALGVLNQLPEHESLLFSAPSTSTAAEMNSTIKTYMQGKSTDLLVVRGNIQVNKDLIESLSPEDRPKFVLRAGTGMNNIDTDYLDTLGIQYSNTPDVNTKATAELAIGMLIAAARKIPQADQAIKQGKWNREAYTGIELNGKTLGIIGVGGRIGSQLAKLAKVFGMTVVGLRPRAIPKNQAPSSPVDHYADSLQELMHQSNVVSVHVPLTPATKNMIGSKEIAAMPPQGILLNLARENVINEKAILEALDNGHLYAAAIDVFQEEKKDGVSSQLAAHPKVVATPHIGGQTKEASRAMAQAVLDTAHALYQEKIQTELAQSRPLNHTKPH
jgi:phosphoglycerate dehydrogenase-like enzyme